MASYNAVYAVLVMLVAVVGVGVTLWRTDTPREMGRFASAATALAVAIFAVALTASLAF